MRCDTTSVPRPRVEMSAGAGTQAPEPSRQISSGNRRAKPNDIPVFIVEDHNEVLAHIYRGIGSKRLAFEGLTLLHFDSHPDLLVPANLAAKDVFNKERLFESISIESWILPAVYAGHVFKVVWMKPYWSQQITDGSYTLQIGSHSQDNTLRVTCTEAYFLSEGLYSPAEELEHCRPMELEVITLDPSPASSVLRDPTSITNSETVRQGQEAASLRASEAKRTKYESTGDTRPNVMDGPMGQCVNSFKPSDWITQNSKQVCPGLALKEPFILDIDLDFFSTMNPFKAEFTPTQYQLIRELYSFEMPISGCENEASSERKHLLGQLGNYFNDKAGGRTNEVHLSNSDRSEILHRLVKSLPPETDWELVHNVGCTCDVTDLPHHVSTELEITQLCTEMEEILQSLPQPSMITIARSSIDDYCPKNQVDAIQENVINRLERIYDNLVVKLDYLA